MLSYFYAAQLLTLLLTFKIPMPPNAEMIVGAVKDTVELNALPKEAIKEALSEAPPVRTLLETGGILALATLPVVVGVLVVFSVLYILAKKFPEKFGSLVTKIKNILFFALII